MTSSALQRLMNDREIEQLLFEYCRAADANDPDSLAECFTDDCVARYAPGPPSIGRAARRDQAARDLALFSATSHQLTNVAITYLDDDCARAESVVQAWHRFGPDGSGCQLWARYRDLVRRTASGWRIAERELLLVDEDGFPPDWAWLHAERAVTDPDAPAAAGAAAAAASTPVMCERRGGVLVISVSRPAVRNAYNRAVAQGVSDAVDALERDDELIVGVLHGTGGFFSAGMDLRAFLQGETPEIGGHGLLGLVRRLRTKPLLAAVDGYAIGAGFEVAVACDVIVAARDAWFSLPEVSRGLVPAGGALRNLPRRIPAGIATDLVLSGSHLSARRGLELGLVARLAPPHRSLETALGLAEEISRGSPRSVIAAKAVLDGQSDWSTEEFWRRQAEIVDPIISGADSAEGASAYLERRDPVWKTLSDAER